MQNTRGRRFPGVRTTRPSLLSDATRAFPDGPDVWSARLRQVAYPYAAGRGEWTGSFARQGIRHGIR